MKAAIPLGPLSHAPICASAACKCAPEKSSRRRSSNAATAPLHNWKEPRAKSHPNGNRRENARHPQGKAPEQKRDNDPPSPDRQQQPDRKKPEIAAPEAFKPQRTKEPQPRPAIII